MKKRCTEEQIIRILEEGRAGMVDDESLNGKFRDKCLNEHWFTALKEAKKFVKEWQHEYNMYRSHSSLKGNLPFEMANETKSAQLYLRLDPRIGQGYLFLNNQFRKVLSFRTL